MTLSFSEQWVGEFADDAPYRHITDLERMAIRYHLRAHPSTEEYVSACNRLAEDPSLPTLVTNYKHYANIN